MKKDAFNLPNDIIYLDGNSLGPLPTAAKDRINNAIVDEWGKLLIKGWNDAGWMAQPRILGDRIGNLIGCPSGSVVIGDTLSIKVYQALASALAMRSDRKVVLSDNGNFPTDLYMAEGLLRTLDKGHRLDIVEPEKVEEHLSSEVAVLMLTQVDYRTGRMHDFDKITKAAHEVGAVVIWDLAHSAGAVPVNMTSCQAEFAVGCTYKYLNGGPGAPAFIYVRPDLIDDVQPALAGWLGHDAPFSFELEYRPAPRSERMRVGTPPVLQMAALDAALSVWEGVSMDDVREKSVQLSELFIKGVEEHCPELVLASPRMSEERGSQVSFLFEHGYAVIRALIDRNVIGDFRAPDIMRFGFTPLYLDEEDVLKAVQVFNEVMKSKPWTNPKYKKRDAVT